MKRDLLNLIGPALRRRMVARRPRRAVRLPVATAILAAAAGLCVLAPTPAGALADYEPPEWSASYDVSATPYEWRTNRSQTYTVKATNVGNIKWTAAGPERVRLGIAFANTAGGHGNNVRYTDQRWDLPYDVAPGSTVAFRVTVTAPAKTGDMVLETQMLKENRFWFSQFAVRGVWVGSSDYLASYDVAATPTSWTAG
ncbi:MAG: hypothetical protein ACR2KK_23850 [Acidimicrobiales bacterium]